MAARKAGRGLWAWPIYRVRRAGAVTKGDAGSFQIVEGKVANVGTGNGGVLLDFSEGRGFTAAIAAEDRKAFLDFDLQSLIGHTIRLRGTVEIFGGQPQIALSNPAQIELLEP